VPNISDITADFSLLDDWEDRYRYLIELGRSLPPLPEALRTDANKVRGCASQVWLATSIKRSDGQHEFGFVADSDFGQLRESVCVDGRDGVVVDLCRPGGGRAAQVLEMTGVRGGEGGWHAAC